MSVRSGDPAQTFLLAITVVMGICTFGWSMAFSLPLFELGTAQMGSITSPRLVPVQTFVYTAEEALKLGLITTALWLPQVAILARPLGEGAPEAQGVRIALIFSIAYWLIMTISAFAIFKSVQPSQALFTTEIRRHAATELDATVKSMLALAAPISSAVCITFSQYLRQSK